jgi:rhodanese-related sulfurtransferase
MFNSIKNIFGATDKMNLGELIQDDAFLVDVRTPGEFAEAKIKGSVNIPLDALTRQLVQFKGKKHIIVFCRSGNRSSMAKSILEQYGFKNVTDGGSFQNVKQYVK